MPSSSVSLKQRLDSLSDASVRALYYDWPTWARNEQLPPAGDWTTWLLMGGRGSSWRSIRR